MEKRNRGREGKQGGSERHTSEERVEKATDTTVRETEKMKG